MPVKYAHKPVHLKGSRNCTPVVKLRAKIVSSLYQKSGWGLFRTLRPNRYFKPTWPRQRGAESGKLLRPAAGISTGAGFDVILVTPLALIARTTYE